MSFIATKYPAGTFSYTDVSSTNLDSTKKFMNDLLGWTSRDVPTEPGRPDYTQFLLDGHIAAGGMPMPEDMQKMKIPSMWNSYVTVENVDATLKKALELGGKEAMPAMDVMDKGRMAAIIDPEGGAVMIWQAGKSAGCEIVNTAGAMSWNELYVKDLNRAKDFYGKLFGWIYEPMKGMEKTYAIIKNNGRNNGGIMQMDEMMEKSGMPAKWMTYFTVKNLDESVAKVKELGGVVYATKPISVGKIAIVADPTGASFILMEMNIPPSDWVE